MKYFCYLDNHITRLILKCETKFYYIWIPSNNAFITVYFYFVVKNSTFFTYLDRYTRHNWNSVSDNYFSWYFCFFHGNGPESHFFCKIIKFSTVWSKSAVTSVFQKSKICSNYAQYIDRFFCFFPIFSEVPNLWNLISLHFGFFDKNIRNR